ncbi:permease [Jonesia denitrificans]|uniref:Permease n=1 Tax=Jonesia denitrificans (strain ATCC 14870 / DSM 20603 / BCRC 15368 / CIP 55.134 / JCM 11481 / NBRC 15587 / NCTC 10816 / Prevot 55134) TaxID=471856 RepID=C7R1S4_JONDD|nr:permease [Jonesia denitrificans]ACV08392.1 permease [Jonesia denitrificans DSM 20603]ASE07959.1 permease [Jonesia denitrificans]QXB42564.1 permease [Jonesia denitrificans]SQH20370.1 Predicted permease [Jonesia denitrificans]
MTPPRALTSNKEWVLKAHVLGFLVAVVGLFALNEWAWDALFAAIPGVAMDHGWGAALHFFLYDTTKIMLLLVGIIFLVGLLRASINTDKVRDWLAGKGLVVGLLLAIVFGVITPFCSCSSIPLFIGFVAAGIPLSITLTFLIASPLVSEVAALLIATHFGWQIAGAYVLSGVVIAFVIGLVLSRFSLDQYLEPIITRTTTPLVPPSSAHQPLALTWQSRVDVATDDVRDIVGKVWPWILVGVGVGAAIHGWVPASFFSSVAGSDNLLAVPAVSLAAVPLYANGGAVIPIAEAMWAKGLPVGTMLAFIMSAIALSIPEAIMLRRTMKPQLLVIFFGSATVGIMTAGYLFNFLFA